ncbi:hypothetical protein C5167_019742 [Papaver somniferum]|uniref:Uncharacterized protein n=1 Tax=Papaver somniferum TaxID=3469 RepID=A0A4Y7IT49_PAPSO|nr:hypothetical protein C5167_019742 [Papaver somniferum]
MIESLLEREETNNTRMLVWDSRLPKRPLKASVIVALVDARLGYRTLNKDPDPMASFSLAYLFILFPFQGICSLRDTEQDDNKWPLVMTSWKCRSYKNVDLGFKTPGEATEVLLTPFVGFRYVVLKLLAQFIIRKDLVLLVAFVFMNLRT